ncbi:MAG: 30S ribosomal protein S6 [Desulfobulbaceae bacterium]|jgi:small subunit ribosomal protein S6|nr:30S ribosomal protein S6 [Desulfobulbaceae bacterium]MDY0350937.1 30S ribosomal protein S6 [Desulfobulbaceae bacterium]
MRRYETTYILRPNLGEEQFSEIIDRTNGIIGNDGGTIIHLERWGTRKLAYEINKETSGHYVYCDYAAPGTTVQELERIFRIDDRILRYLTVKLEESIDQETIAREVERVAAAAVARSTASVREDEEETEVESGDDEDLEEDASDKE